MRESDPTDALRRNLAPLWSLGITSLAPLLETHHGRPHLISTSAFALIFIKRHHVSPRQLHDAQLSLNRVSLYLNGHVDAFLHTTVSSLPLSQRELLRPHDFCHLPQPLLTVSLSRLASKQFPRPAPAPAPPPPEFVTACPPPAAP